MQSSNSLLTKVEERVVFQVSRTVWHVFVAMAIVSVVIGIGVLGWSGLPASKRDVTKDAYPSPVAVSVGEVQAALKAASQPVKPAAKVSAAPAPAKPVADPDQAAYQKAFARLKALFPTSHYHWQDVMDWEYPYGREAWDYFQDPDYRRQVVRIRGVESLVNQWAIKAEAGSFAEKAQLIDAYATVLAPRAVPLRGEVMDALGLVSTSPLATAVANIRAVGAVIAPLPTKHEHYAGVAASFITSQSTGGAEALTYFGKTIAAFAKAERTQALDILVRSYGPRFGNAIEQMTESVDGFVPMLAKLKPGSQAKALAIYLNLYTTKDADRAAAVRDIDSRFETESQQAESAFEAARIAKESSRPLALYAVAGGVGLTATVALLLVLLSIQRYLKAIVDRLDNGAITAVLPALNDGGLPARKRLPTQRALARSEET